MKPVLQAVKKNLSTIILVIIFFIGLSLLLYPTLSDYWNSFHQSRAIATYTEAVKDLDGEEQERLLESARAYNQKLFEEGHGLGLSEAEEEEYQSQLKLETSEIMSYISIDKINCCLPIYHGTEDSVLQVAVGHIAGSSLPVGGESTHCVLSGHRGLPSAQLFSKLDELEVGDTFVLQTLGETLTYEVDKISIVLPDELDDLAIVEGEDLCTLVTCTPYGVNTHRLLVRGHRVDNRENTSLRISSEAEQIQPVLIAPLFAAPMLLALLAWLILHTRTTKDKNKQGDEGNES